MLALSLLPNARCWPEPLAISNMARRKHCHVYNPLTYDEARSLEVELGIDLREGGFGVWQA